MDEILYDGPAPRCSETLDMFETVPDPPTGPEADAYAVEDGRPEKYLAWRESPDGEAFLESALAMARVELQAGAKRFSVLGYIHAFRASRRIRVNNTFAPWIADDLVAADPGLLDIIERRARRKEGP